MADLMNIREIKTDMIRRHAEAYAMTHRLPRNEREFARLLYEFDQTVNGALEAMLDRTLTLQRNLQDLANTPVLVRRDALTVTEAPRAD